MAYYCHSYIDGNAPRAMTAIGRIHLTLKSTPVQRNVILRTKKGDGTLQGSPGQSESQGKPEVVIHDFAAGCCHEHHCMPRSG